MSNLNYDELVTNISNSVNYLFVRTNCFHTWSLANSNDSVEYRLQILLSDLKRNP